MPTNLLYLPAFGLIAGLLVSGICASAQTAALASESAAREQTTIRSLTGLIEGHQVGGVSIDLIGNIYVADFGDVVWQITPEGERHVYASGLYGASGNAIDKEGNLWQSSFYGDSITKIDRKGRQAPSLPAA
jgi:hypothetical protein